MVEHVQTAGDVDFQRRGDELGLLFLLRPESIVQILQDGHILRPGVGEVLLIHQPHTAVNHCFLHRLEAVFTAHNNVAEGQQEVHLQRQRVLIVRVVQVEVHGVDVLLAGGGDLNDLTAQAADQGEILCLRVADDNIVIGDEENIEDFTLGAETLAAAGGSEDKAVGVFQSLSVHHDEVAAQSVEAVVQGFGPVLEQLLGGKGDKNSGA